MSQDFNLINLIFLLGATQGLFLAILLLFNKSGNRKANRYLALLMIAYSAFIAEASISRTSLGLQCPHLLGLAAGMIYLVGPFHYLYARTLIFPSFDLKKVHLLHVIPFMAFYLSLLFPFYLLSGSEKIEYFQKLENQGPPPILLFFGWVVLIQGTAYLVWTLMLLKKHRRDIRETFSTLERINLTWLRTITLMSLALWGLGLVIEILQIFRLVPTLDISVPLTTALLVYAMGYLGLRQPEIFSGPATTRPLQKYRHSGLSPERARRLYEKLAQYMETERPFTDADLKLGQLAHRLAVSPNHLSQVINAFGGQNFFDFVNGYRIQEAKKRIAEDRAQILTLLSIAYDAGFNSKSAFNAAFKKHADMTPSQYRKSLQK